MTNDVLKKFLKDRNLKVSNNKAALVERALTALGLELLAEGDIGWGGGDVATYPEYEKFDLGYRFKGWFYLCCCNATKRGDEILGRLVFDIVNCVNHWSGDHSNCALLDPGRSCCTSKAEARHIFFEHGGPTYVAISEWLATHIRPTKMKHSIQGRENLFLRCFILLSTSMQRSVFIGRWCTTHDLLALQWT